MRPRALQSRRPQALPANKRPKGRHLAVCAAERSSRIRARTRQDQPSGAHTAGMGGRAASRQKRASGGPRGGSCTEHLTWFRPSGRHRGTAWTGARRSGCLKQSRGSWNDGSVWAGGVLETLAIRVGSRLADYVAGRIFSRGDKLHGRQFGIIAVHSGKALDVPSASQRGAVLSQWSWSGSANQLWQFQRLRRDTYRIQSVSTGLCMDVSDESRQQAARVVQWNWNGGPHQRWRLIEMARGIYRLQPRHSDMCLDVNQSSWDDGAYIQQWPCNGGANQQWELREAGN
jgi:hypothetical protein